MIVTYRTASDVLLTRPQTVHPRLGEHIILMREGGVGQRYRVIDVEWPVQVPAHRYYSITDESDVQVQVFLEPCRASQEETP